MRVLCILNYYYKKSFSRRAKRLFRGGQGNRLGASVTVNEAFTEAVRLRQPPQLIEINRDSFSYLTTSVKNFHNKKSIFDFNFQTEFKNISIHVQTKG